MKGLQPGQAVATPERRARFVDFLRVVGPGQSCIGWPWSRREGVYVHVSTDPTRPLIYAHRWVWEQINGLIPDGYEVCHNCPNGDNPACVRPSHLWLGTHSQNIQDSFNKGRSHGNRKNHPVGEAHHSTKLTVADVYDIRRRCDAGVNQRQLAREYGVTPTAINAIAKRRSWRHLPDEDRNPPAAQA